MRIGLFYVLVLGTLVGACSADDDSAAAKGPPPAAMVAPDLQRIAEGIVTRTANVTEGEVVAISGGVRDLALLENLAIEVRKRGAHPIVQLSTEGMNRRSYDEVPAKYDAQPDKWGRIIGNSVDVVITVDIVETPDLLAHVPPERIAARNEAAQANQKLAMARRIRFVDIGNGMYPTHARASRFGISRDEMAKFFWNALSSDFTEIVQNGEKLTQILAGAKQLHITTPNGTNLTVGIMPGTTLISDGIISDADRKTYAGSFAYLPAGEVYLRTIPGSAQGKIVVDHYYYQGTDIRDLVINVEAGKMTTMTAASSMDALQANFAQGGAGRELLTLVDFGVNPGIDAQGTALRTWVPAGMVTPYFGNDLWAGGTNDTPVSLSPFLANATVKADGRTIVENGKLKL
jgi:leucyl aminopeptidase (aminopeptidase T)